MNQPTDRPTRAAERLNTTIDRLLAERRPGAAADAEEASLLQVAALLKHARPACAEPRPTFLAKLEERLARERRPRRGLSRRAALTGGAALAAGAAGVAFGRLAAPQAPEPPAAQAPAGPVQSPPPSAELDVVNGEWYPVARVGDVPPGGAVAFSVGSVIGHVLNQEGTLLALSAVCTHMACILRWREREQDFLCPCHGATFSAVGAFQPRRAGAWQPPLPKLRLRVEDDQVYVWAAAAPEVT